VAALSILATENKKGGATVRTIKLTVLGGGSAQSRLLMILIALKGYLFLQSIDLQISSVVSVADDGGSTGTIRKLFGGPGLGDTTNIMAAVARNRSIAEIFKSRYGKEAGLGLAHHRFGNLFVERAAHVLPGGYTEALQLLSTILDCQADVYPASLDSSDLCVRLSTGLEICGEHKVDEPKHDGTLQITDVWLSPSAQLNPAARQAISMSDVILISAGDPYGSIGAVLKVNDVPQEIARSKARIGMIVPLFNRYGQSTGWTAADYIRFEQELLCPAQLCTAFFDTSIPSDKLVELYAKGKEDKVPEGNLPNVQGVRIYRGDYMEEVLEEASPGDELRRSSLMARHSVGIAPDLQEFLVG
jgi:uncharacterized cofD-like protein